MASSAKPDYTRLITEKVGSEEWRAEERAVVNRAFELKRLRVVSRGEHKNEIAVKRSSLSPEMAGMVSAEFEWAVVMHATEVLSKFDVLMVRWSGWEGFLVENPLSDPLRAAAKRIGTSLGYAVAIWNDLGAEWKDLWDHFDLEAKPGEQEQRWQGFLAFYRVFQKARSFPDSYDTMADLAEQIVLKIFDAVEARERTPFAEDSDIVHLLRLCNVPQGDLDRLKSRYSYWTAIRNVHYWEATMDQAKPPLQKDFDVRLIAENKSLWGEFFAEMFQDKGMINFLNYAWLSGLRFDVNRHLQDAAAIRVSCAPRNGVLNFHCLVSLNDQKSTGMFHPFVALLHEVGHFVQGSQWMMELALADFIIAHCPSLGIDSLRLVQARQEVQRRIALFHSAAEVGADEFVVSIMLPDEENRKIYEEYSEGKRLYMWGYHAKVATVLGLVSDEVYYHRFEPIVSDRAPDLTGPGKLIIRSPRLREARRKISEERIMRLLDSFWRDVSEIVSPAMGRP